MGDTVLMTAPLLELRNAFPEAEIHALVHEPWASLLENHPGVNRIWTYVRHKEKTSRAKALARLAFQLRPQRFDCVLNFHASPSSATLAFATGARIRSIHFHGHLAKNRYSTVDVPGKGQIKPIIERDMDTVRALGVHVPAGRHPVLFLQEQEKKLGQERLSGLGLDGPLLTIGLGASRPAKSWPLERYGDLAVAWTKKTGGPAIALVAENEKDEAIRFLKAVDNALMAEFSDGAERAKVRSGITVDSGLPLRTLSSLLAHSTAFVGNDSGPKHIAVAVGVPTVTLFGPEHPFEWHPYSPVRHPYFFKEGLSCRKDALPGMPAWCGLDICTQEQHRCMTDIGVNEVLQKCLELSQVL